MSLRRTRSGMGFESWDRAGSRDATRFDGWKCTSRSVMLAMKQQNWTRIVIRGGVGRVTMIARTHVGVTCGGTAK